MITVELKESLSRYINENYVAAGSGGAYKREGGDSGIGGFAAGRNYSADFDYVNIEKDAGFTFSKKESFTLEQILEEVGESFHEMLFMRIDMSGMTDVEVYKRANIDRKLFSKIRSNPAYHPRKQTVLALAIALKLNIDDTVDLLSRAEYALSPSNKGDLIVKYFIERGVYDIMTINFALDEYGEPILG